MPVPIDPLIENLIAKLNHRDPVTRCHAAAALRLHGRRAVAAIPALKRLLADEDARVRQEAQHALDRLSSVAA